MKKSDLKYNIAALREFKALTGVNPFKLTNDDVIDPDIFGALTYVGLKYGKYSDKKEKPTREEIEEDLKLEDATLILEAFADWCYIDVKEDETEKN